MSTSEPPTFETPRLEVSTSEPPTMEAARLETQTLQTTASLNRDIRRIFLGYYLQNTKGQLQFSYHDSRTENSYLIGATLVDHILGIYLLNKFWRDAVHRLLRSLPYKVVIESTGGRRLKYPANGRLLTDSESLRQSRTSQQFVLFMRGPLAYAIKSSELETLVDFGLLRPTASALDYAPHSNTSLRHFDWEEWLHDLEELDFYPMFPRKSIHILKALLDKSVHTLKRLYLPNFIRGFDLKLDRFEFSHLRKCFMTCLVGEHPAEPIASFLPYFSLNTKTLEFNMEKLANCSEMPPNIAFHPNIENLELSFMSVDEPSHEVFLSWIHALNDLPTRLRKLSFAAHSLYVTKKEAGFILDYDFFYKNRLLLGFMAELNHSLISGERKALKFKLLAEFDIRCSYEEARRGLRVGGELLTLQLIINAENRNSGIFIGFERDQKPIKEPVKLDVVGESRKDIIEKIQQHWSVVLDETSLRH